MSRKEGNSVSLINWILTVLVCSIPGVNLIAYILFVIFGRARSKRRFAAANLIVIGLIAILIVAALIAFPDAMKSAADWLRDYAQTQLSPVTPAA